MERNSGGGSKVSCADILRKSPVTAVLLGMLAAQVCAADLSTRDNLLVDDALNLFIPFDGEVEPKIAAKAVSPTLEGTHEFEAGRVGEALSFSESGAVALSMPISDNIDLRKGTIMFWFMPRWSGNDATGNYTLLWVNMSSPNKYLAIHRSFDPAQPLALYFNLQWDAVIQSTTDSHFKAGEWIHVAMTWDAEKNVFAVYFSGRQIGTTEWPDVSSSPDYVPQDLRLGAYYRGPDGDQLIDALYDEFAIFHRALTMEEIAAYVGETEEK